MNVSVLQIRYSNKMLVFLVAKAKQLSVLPANVKQVFSVSKGNVYLAVKMHFIMGILAFVLDITLEMALNAKGRA